MNLELKDKRALVFGGSKGIGLAIAKVLREEGASVTISSRTKQSLEKTSRELDMDFFCCDLSQSGDATRAVQYVMKKKGGIDLLVINTGGPLKGNFLDVEIEQWQHDYQSLWLSSLEALKAALPSMIKNKFGRILFITSLAAKEPLAGLTTSNALRAGFPGLCRSLSNEHAKDGITFNMLLPGYTNTERLQELKLTEEKVKSLVPAGRLADPRELGDLAAFLLSPRASYITAQSILIDGGATKGF
jgi:3-oxoacyl-[acyl-carrier protein] reductase